MDDFTVCSGCLALDAEVGGLCAGCFLDQFCLCDYLAYIADNDLGFDFFVNTYANLDDNGDMSDDQRLCAVSALRNYFDTLDDAEKFAHLKAFAHGDIQHFSDWTESSGRSRREND